MSKVEEYGLMFMTGLMTTLLGLRIYDYIEETHNDDAGGISQDRLLRVPPEDFISLEDLSSLLKSQTINMKKSALKIIVDRALSGKHLRYILDAVQSDNESRKLKALVVVKHLSQNDRNKTILVNMKTLKILVKALKSDMPEELQKTAVASIYQLILENDNRKAKAASYGLIEVLCSFLNNRPARYSDLKYWSILVLHQLCVTDKLFEQLFDNKVIFILADMLKLTFGTPSMQKLCLHGIVRLLGSFSDQFAEKVLQDLAKMKLISLTSSCLRNNDSDLVSWSIFLIHEFVTRKVQVEEICKIRGLVKIYQPYIRITDTILPRVILRTLKCLCDENVSFYRELIRGKIIPKVIKCLKSNDEQTQYWSLALLHNVVYQMGSHKQLLKLGLMDALLSMPSNTALIHIQLYIIEIYGVLCADPENIKFLESTSLAEKLMQYIDSTDSEIQQSAISVLINIAAVSESITSSIVQHDGIHILTALFLHHGNGDAIRILACKAVLSLIYIDPELRFETLVYSIRPGFQLLIAQVEQAIKSLTGTTSPTSSNEKSSGSPQSTKQKPESPTDASIVSSSIMSSTVTELMLTPIENKFSDVKSSIEQPLSTLDHCNRLQVTINCLEVLMNSGLLFDSKVGREQSFESYMDDLMDDISAALMNCLVFKLIDNDKKDFSDLSNAKSEIAYYGLRCLLTLFRVEKIREFVFKENLFSLLISYLDSGDDKLTKQIFLALPKFLMHGFSTVEVINTTNLFPKLLKEVSMLHNDSIWPYFNSFISLASDFSCTTIPSEYVQLSLTYSSPNVDLFGSTLHVSNHSWTFESVRATHGVSMSGKYAYEFQVGSSGIIQIGWASAETEFNEYGGWGVGDDKHSYAFDGNRKRKWHGRDVDEDSYGELCDTRDVITSIIDFNDCTISFSVNGKDMGIAFREIDRNQTWYPTVSMTGEQFGQFAFGSLLDPLRYRPADAAVIPYYEDDVFFSCENVLINQEISLETNSVQSSNESPQSQVSFTTASEPVYSPILDDVDPDVEDGVQPPNSNDCSKRLISDLQISNQAISDKLVQLKFYYEIQIGRTPSSHLHFQFGCLFDTENVICLVYEKQFNTVVYLKLLHNLMDKAYFDIVVNQFVTTLCKSKSDDYISYPNGILEAYLHPQTLKEGSYLGVALDSISNSCFFTLDGHQIGQPIHTHSTKSTLPFFRNMPRYLLNFGQYDFKFIDANFSFSPTSIPF